MADRPQPPGETHPDLRATRAPSRPGGSAVHRPARPAAGVPVYVADPAVVDDRAELERACRRVGAELALYEVSQPGVAGQHDALRLGAAYRDILETPRPAR